MTTAHLTDLRNALEANHWRIVGDLPGDEDRVVGVWQIARPDGSNRLDIEFAGDPLFGGGPIEASSYCYLKEHPRIDLYFARIGRSWTAKLAEFMGDLNGAASD